VVTLPTTIEFVSGVHFKFEFHMNKADIDAFVHEILYAIPKKGSRIAFFGMIVPDPRRSAVRIAGINGWVKITN